MKTYVFRVGTDQPPDPEAYHRSIVANRYGSSAPPVSAWRIAGIRDPLDARQCRLMYNAGKSMGGLDDFGEPTGDWTGTGSDGRHVVALFFE